MFNVVTRELIFNNIVNNIYKQDNVVAIIAIGSGSYGFKDEFSDVDLSIVVDKKENLINVMENVKKFIENNYDLNISMEENSDKRALQVFFTVDMLELDIGYQLFDKLIATKKEWKVLKDKTGKIESLMKKGWKKTLANFKKESLVDKEKKYADGIWHFIYLAIKSVKRNEILRSIKEIDSARAIIIDLLCYQLDINYDHHYKNVDNLPEKYKLKILATYPNAFDQNSINHTIIKLIDLAYELNSNIALSKEALLKYFKDVNNIKSAY